jgi:hypothetical protein
MGKLGTNPFGDHALFPFDDDEEPKEIAFIQVIRHEDGRSKQVPRMFRADELTSLQDIFNLFGGGLYELWGRGPGKHPDRPGRIAANRRYEIAGLSKPLVDDGSSTAGAAAVAAPPPATVFAAPVPAAGGPPTDVMGMFMQMQMNMFQVQQAAQREAAEERRRADERARQDSQQMFQMLAQTQATSMQGMMGVLTAVVSRTGDGGGGPEAMGKYVELFSKMGIMAKAEGAGEVAEGGGVGEILSNLADIVQGAVQLKEGGGLLGGGAPPGSAASLMGTSPFKPPQGGGQVPPVAT